jgi:hypothetical protein
MIMFSRIQNQGRSRMNFAALIFGGAWLLYRKQYKRGIIFTILSGGLYALNLVFSLLFTQPMMEEIYQSLGYSTTTNVTNTVLDQIALGVKALSPGAMALFFLPLLFTALRWALHIFLAIKANRWYKDYCVNTVKDVMATATTQLDEEELFKKRGGINTPVAFGIVALYFAASYLLPILL